MARPFNFFQTSEFGVVGSGIVSAYKTNFSGFYTPISMSGVTGGYHFFSSDLDVSIPTIEIALNASVVSSFRDDYTLGLSLNGIFYPVIPETATTQIQFSGKQERAYFDTSTYVSVFSGSLSSGILDKPDYVLVPTGALSQGNLDPNNYNINVSGTHPKTFNEFANYSLGITGKFVGTEKDLLQLDMSFDSFIWQAGNPQLSEQSTDDLVNIDLSFTQFFWRQSQ